MNGKLNELIAYITENYPFTEKRFPEMEHLTEDQQHALAIRHLALHAGKTTGKLIGVSEAADHGAPIDVELLKVEIPKALINTLRLAELVGMTEKDLLMSLEEKYGTPFVSKN